MQLKSKKGNEEKSSNMALTLLILSDIFLLLHFLLAVLFLIRSRILRHGLLKLEIHERTIQHMDHKPAHLQIHESAGEVVHQEAPPGDASEGQQKPRERLVHNFLAHRDVLRQNRLRDGAEAQHVRHDGVGGGVRLRDVQLLAFLLQSSEDGGDVQECGVGGDEESEGDIDWAQHGDHRVPERTHGLVLGRRPQLAERNRRKPGRRKSGASGGARVEEDGEGEVGDDDQSAQGGDEVRGRGGHKLGVEILTRNRLDRLTCGIEVIFSLVSQDNRRSIDHLDINPTFKWIEFVCSCTPAQLCLWLPFFVAVWLMRERPAMVNAVSRRTPGAVMLSNPATLAIAAIAATTLLLLALRTGSPASSAALPLPQTLPQEEFDREFPVYSKVLHPKREVWNGTEFVFQVPAHPRAVIFLAHGCYCKATFFWDKHPDCGLCSGAPEERAFVIQALQASYAVIAISSREDCWRQEDSQRAKLALESWIEKFGLAELPLLGLGASSGGYFLSTFANVVRFDAIVVMIAEGVFHVVPSSSYPPVLFVHMVKDETTAERIQAVIPVLRKAGIRADEIQCKEVRITDDFFLQRIPYMELAMSERLVGALQQSGHLNEMGYLKVDSRSLKLKQDMRGSFYHEGQELLDSLSGRHDNWEHHVQEELNLAYGFHEFTSLPTGKIITWLESHVKMPSNVTADGQS